MRAEDWFALAVRVVGITVLIAGLGTLLDALLLKLGYFHYPDSQPAYYVIYGAAEVVLGLYLIRGAAFLVGFAYWGDEEDEVDDEEEIGQNENAKL